MNETNVSYDNLINIKFEFHKGLFNEIIYHSEDIKLENFCRDDLLVRIKLIFFSRVLCAVKLGRVTCQDCHLK